MTDEHDYDLAMDDGSDEGQPGVRRFIPMMVVAIAISGFAGLAWYAYHAGSNAVSEEDLLLIEADKSPLKETPADPGGMKFPHQDKTIFQAFSGQPNDSAQVERVIPAPEEPMEKPAATSETKTWVNEKLRRGSETIEPEAPAAGGESTSAPVTETKPAEAPVAKTAAPAAAKNTTPVEVDRSARQERAEKPAAVVPAPAVTAAKEEPKAEATPVASAPAAAVESKPVEVQKVEIQEPVKPNPLAPKPVEKKAEVKPAAKASATQSGGSGKIQLGAYKSDAEAKGEWAKIAKRNADSLGGLNPTVVRADLGEKGVFYRLQVHGLSSAAAAKELCGKLQAKGQQCILPVGK